MNRGCDVKFIGTLLLAFALAPGLAAQSPEETVAGCVEALGGKEAIEKWSDYRAKAEAKFLRYGRELNGNVEIIEKGVKKRTRTELAFGKETFVMVRGRDLRAPPVWEPVVVRGDWMVDAGDGVLEIRDWALA